MGLRYPNQTSGTCFFVTTTFKDWNRYGDVPGMYQELLSSLQYCTSKYDARIIGYVLMPSHLHLILSINGKQLSSFMRDFKKYVTQKSAVDLGIKTDQLWVPRYDRVEIISLKVLRTKLRYIHENPVKAGLCFDPEDWPWSSAQNYGGGESVIPVWKDWAP